MPAEHALDSSGSSSLLGGQYHRMGGQHSENGQGHQHAHHHPRYSLGNVEVIDDPEPGESVPGQFSFLVSLAFCLNYVLGTGFLTLPWAFAQVGAVLGVLCLCATALLCNIAKDYLIEVMARAECLEFPDEGLDRSEHGGKADGGAINDGLGGSGGASQNGADLGDSAALLRELRSGLTVKTRKYEVPVLCEIFLGHPGKVSYLVCLCVYIYGALWAYGSVFASACSATFPLPASSLSDSYPAYLALFALLVWPLSCLEITEQVFIQVVLALCRVVMVVLMVTTTGLAYDDRRQDFPGQTGAMGIGYFNASNLYRFLPISVYAFIYHHSIPGLSHPVRDKKQLGSIFLLTFVLCTLSYGVMGLVVSIFFGPDIPSSSNLAWANYQGAGGGAAAQLISKYVLLFPALDVASAFPLNAITLGNNIMATYYGDEAVNQPVSRGKTVGFRLLAAVPPVLGALVTRNLSTITDWSGTAGFIITFIFPALLQLSSRRMMKDRFQIESAKVFYSNSFSRKAGAPVVLLLGTVMFVYVAVHLIYTESKEGVR